MIAAPFLAAKSRSFAFSKFDLFTFPFASDPLHATNAKLKVSTNNRLRRFISDIFFCKNKNLSSISIVYNKPLPIF